MKKILALLSLVLLTSCVHAQTCNYTANLRLCKPVVNTPGWANGLNADFDTLDSYLSGGLQLNSINTVNLSVTGTATVPTPGNTDNSTTVPNTAWVTTNFSGGGYAAYFANQNAQASDAKKLVVFNCASACTYTLPNPAPTATWYTTVLSIGAGQVTISSTQTLYGSFSALTTNTAVVVYAIGSSGGYAMYQVNPSFSTFNTQTTDYTAVASDNGNVILMDCVTACNFTLPASVNIPNWHVRVMNISTSPAVTVGIVGGYIGPVTLYSNQNLNIYVDGSGTQFYGFGWGNTDVTGTLTLTAGVVAAGTCQTAVQSGVLSSSIAYGSIVEWNYVTGSLGTADALMHLNVFFDSSKVNIVRCNPTSSSQTGTALTVNWKVTH